MFKKVSSVMVKDKAGDFTYAMSNTICDALGGLWGYTSGLDFACIAFHKRKGFDGQLE